MLLEVSDSSTCLESFVFHLRWESATCRLSSANLSICRQSSFTNYQVFLTLGFVHRLEGDEGGEKESDIISFETKGAIDSRYFFHFRSSESRSSSLSLSWGRNPVPNSSSLCLPPNLPQVICTVQCASIFKSKFSVCASYRKVKWRMPQEQGWSLRCISRGSYHCSKITDWDLLVLRTKTYIRHWTTQGTSMS